MRVPVCTLDRLLQCGLRGLAVVRVEQPAQELLTFPRCPKTHLAPWMLVQPLSWYSLPSCIPLCPSRARDTGLRPGGLIKRLWSCRLWAQKERYRPNDLRARHT